MRTCHLSEVIGGRLFGVFCFVFIFFNCFFLKCCQEKIGSGTWLIRHCIKGISEERVITIKIAKSGKLSGTLAF